MTTWDDKPNDYEHALAEIELLRAALEQANTIIIAAKVFIPPRGGWRTDAWLKDADKFLNEQNAGKKE